MNILIAINDKYLDPVVTMLNSLQKNINIPLEVYLLYTSLSDKSIKKLEKFIVKECSGSLHPIYVDSSIFKDSPLKYHFSIEIYFRIIAPKLLPKSLDRILWLDADMIVLKSIEEFYFQDFEEKLLIVSPDSCETFNITYAKMTKNRLNLSDDHIYFNSGLILYNLNKIQENIDYYTQTEIIQEYKNNLDMPDQDILNILYSKKVKYVDNNVYNVQVRCNRKIQIKNIEENAKIVHYIGRIKPWNIRWKNKASTFYWRNIVGIRQFFKYSVFLVLNPFTNLVEDTVKAYIKSN